MKQYNEIKSKHPNALLLFRVGDFYETFGSDAISASKTLGIVLTKRSNGAASNIELAGFPHHSLDTYLPKLVKAGNRVAICDQLEDPKKTKSIVKRGVTELVTPGVSLNDNVLDSKKNNYLASISKEKDLFGISFLDISTGEFSLTNCDFSQLEKLINTYSPSEIICSKKNKEFFLDKFNDNNFFFLEEWVYKIGYSYDKLLSFFNVKNLKGFGACFGASGGYERPMWFALDGEKAEYKYSYNYQSWYPSAEYETNNTLKNVATHVIESNLSNNIFPNPAKDYITIKNTCADNFILYNCVGAKVKNIKINKNQTTIKRGNLTNGLYFYSLIKDGKKIDSGKVLFE